MHIMHRYIAMFIYIYINASVVPDHSKHRAGIFGHETSTLSGANGDEFVATWANLVWLKIYMINHDKPNGIMIYHGIIHGITQSFLDKPNLLFHGITQWLIMAKNGIMVK